MRGQIAATHTAFASGRTIQKMLPTGLIVTFFKQQMHAWAEVCHPLQSSKSPFLRSIGWRITGFLQTLPAHQQYSNSAILRNNYISLLSDLCACVHMKKNGVTKEAIVLQWAVRIASRDFKPGKKRWTGALLSEKCCCFVRKPSWKSHTNLN